MFRFIPLLPCPPTASLSWSIGIVESQIGYHGYHKGSQWHLRRTSLHQGALCRYRFARCSAIHEDGGMFSKYTSGILQSMATASNHPNIEKRRPANNSKI
jgi:hypothetical protein